MNSKYWLIMLSLLPLAAFASPWKDLWQTPDQQGTTLLQSGNPQAAAQTFKDKNWQSVSHYRAGNYEQAYKQFSANQTSDGQYNAGNAAAYMEKYQEALSAYDKAIALNPKNADAVTNRDIVKKLLQQQEQKKDQQQKKDDKSSADKNKSNQDNSPDKKQADKQDTQPQNSPPSDKKNAQNNKDNSGQPDQPKPSQSNRDNKQDQAAASPEQQKQDENTKQIMRRLPDDSGGLLQRKFLRDYARRHGEATSDQDTSYVQYN